MRQDRRLLSLLGLVAGTLAAAGPASAQGPCQYWVAPTPQGNDSNPGTSTQPWATLDWASARVLALAGSNCTVWFKDGVYTGANSLYERFATPTTFKAVNAYRAVLQNSSRAVSLFGARNMVFEGFELRHSGPGAAALVVQVQQDGGTGLWSEDVVFRNNVFHDSWNNDILKINNGARFITVEDNVFYNQAGSDEHIDVNSVTDVVIRDNVFFNDFAGSGRPNANDTSSFIVIKDSNAGDDGQIGSERITVRRNVFLSWEGSAGHNFVLVGEDGQPFFEAQQVRVENNLMIGNAPNEMRAPFGVKGGKDVTFRSNTVVGDLPGCAYALRLNQEGSNPRNENVFFWNNVWSDPTGSMGAGCAGGNDFSDGAPAETLNAVLDRNLYWNGGATIPPGDVLSPLVDDARRVVGDPRLNLNQAGIVLPRWSGTSFPSGSTTIRQEFERLVATYGAPGAGSAALDQADPTRAPVDDIRGRPRRAGAGTAPDLGAFEVGATGFAIVPTSGPSAGGARLTLTGAGFETGATVTVGGTAAGDVFVGSPSFCLATSPVRPPGTLNDVILTNPSSSSSLLPSGYLSDFLDVPGAHLFHDFVEKLVRHGVTGGCGGGNYCPDAAVSRQQMAVFLLTSKEGPGYTPPPCTSPTFSDVPCSSPYARWIYELAGRGVTGGCGGGNYCPLAPVTREQMAVFLLATREGGGYLPPPCSSPVFSDVPCSSSYASWVYELVARGITGGCGGGRYCPTGATSRGQMAVFLVTTFALP